MEALYIAVYTTELKDTIMEGINDFVEALKIVPTPDVKVDFFEKREQLLSNVREKDYEIAIIAEKGAKGFEATLGIRNNKNKLPLIWITSDEVFGVQSYRMQVQDFLVTPVTPQQIHKSLIRCMEYIQGGQHEKRYS